MSRPLQGQVAIVTGATRGIGRGIALQLGEAGATVYVTGRTLKSSGPVGGSLEDTAKEVESRGGKCVPVQCDHSRDDDIASLFHQVAQEQDGRLDILVNNAYSAVNALIEHGGKSFWEQPISMWDTVNNVGLRNHYLCTWHACQLMVPRRRGLIVNISSAGGLRYLFNTCYGVGKQALDRMAVDCGLELRRHQVACVSLWPGTVQTEELMHKYHTNKFHEVASRVGMTITDEQVSKLMQKAETTEYAGKCVVHLAADPDVMQKSGRVVLTSDLGRQYGFRDAGGRTPGDLRSLRPLVALSGWTRLSTFFPSWLRVPHWVMTLAGNKF